MFHVKHFGTIAQFQAVRLLSHRGASSPAMGGALHCRSPDQETLAAPPVKTLDPMTSRQISPLTAAALCVKPHGQMTASQIIHVDALNAASADFTTMCHLATRFRGLY
jgi:hypothetical protein